MEIDCAFKDFLFEWFQQYLGLIHDLDREACAFLLVVVQLLVVVHLWTVEWSEELAVILFCQQNKYRNQVSFQTSAPNDPKMTLNTKRSQVPHIPVTTIPLSPKFHPVHSMVSNFQDICHCFSSALCYCTAELLSSRGHPSSVVRPSVKPVF